MLHRRAAAMAAPLLILLAACAAPQAPVTTASAPQPASSAAAPSTPQPPPASLAPRTLAARCQNDEAGPMTTFVDEHDRRLTGAVVGSGGHVAILLPQTGGAGVCGWYRWAAWAAGHGVRSVLVDWCGAGGTWCAPDRSDDVITLVGDVLQWTRGQPGVTSVTLVGASRGGAQALGVGQHLGVDAIVDLSGPSEWPGVPSAKEAAASTTVPLLLVIADSDRRMNPDALKAAFAASPAHPKRLVTPDAGHGWDLVMTGSGNASAPSEVGTLVRDWVVGARG